MEGNLNIIQWNCNGIRARAGEIHSLIHDADIAYFQETNLSADVTYTLPGFNIVRRDRITTNNNIDKCPDRFNAPAGEGVLIAIRSDLLYRALDTPTIPNFEITGVALLEFSTPINVINIYRKPQAYTNQSEWKKLLDFTD